MIKIPLVVLALVLIASTSSAQIYKWVDKDGGIHFSNVPTSGDEKKENILTEEDRPPQKECVYPKPITKTVDGTTGTTSKSYNAEELDSYYRCIRNK
jgi:hypothetical protein